MSAPGHTAPTRRPVLIGADVALGLIAFCLLLPNIFGLWDGAPQAKNLLLAVYIAAVSSIVVVAFAARQHLSGPLLAFTLYAVPYTLVVLAKSGGLTDAAYMVTIVMTVGVAAHIRSIHSFFSILALLSIVFATLSIAHWMVTGAGGHYSGLTIHKNSLGAVLFFCFVGLVWMLRQDTSPRDKIVYFCAALGCILLAYVTSSRTNMLTLLAFLFFLGTWRYWSASRKRYFLVLTIVLLGSVSLVPIYVMLSHSPYAADIDQLSLTLSGHRFFTGRDYVWPAHLLLISQAPVWGHGFNTESLTLLKLAAGLSEAYTGLSAHNLYLMILTQTGLVGLSAFVVFVFGVWHLSYERRHDPLAPVLGAMILAYLTHEIFEVSLIQNTLINNWLFWMIVGLGFRAPPRTRESA